MDIQLLRSEEGFKEMGTSKNKFLHIHFEKKISLKIKKIADESTERIKILQLALWLPGRNHPGMGKWHTR